VSRAAIRLSPLTRFIQLGRLPFQRRGYLLKLPCELEKALLCVGGSQIHRESARLFCGVAKLCYLCV